MLTVNFTFDYEVFFHSNDSSYDDILFKPTEKIMDLLDNYNAKGTFFIDVLSYFSMAKAGQSDYTKKFRNQCIEMLKRGHNPQLHIHAHWLSSTYDPKTKKWSNDYKKYRLQDYTEDEIDTAIAKCINFLNECANEAKVTYKCDTFRAGGLILQPENHLVQILIKHGIKFDSSIAPNCTSNNEYAEYNYKRCPNFLNWYFDGTNCCNIAVNEKNSLLEIPVATVRNNVFKYFFIFGHVRIANKSPKGIGFVRPQKSSNFFDSLKRRMFGYSWVSLDTRSAKVIVVDLKTIYKKYKCKQINSFVALIGHPKMFTDKNILNLKLLIEKIKNMKNIVYSEKKGSYWFTNSFEKKI